MAVDGRADSGEEAQSRQEIFEQNLAKIQQHNKAGASWTAGVNAFTDLTVEEFRQVEDPQEAFEALFQFTKDRSVTLSCKEVAQTVQNATFATHVTRTEVTKWLKLAGCTKTHARAGDIWQGLSRAE